MGPVECDISKSIMAMNLKLGIVFPHRPLKTCIDFWVVTLNLKVTEVTKVKFRFCMIP